jgi:hypothetical protein
MNLIADATRQPVEICGYSVPIPSSVIHFYYSVSERRRFAGFLWEGIAAGDACILASSREALETFAKATDLHGRATRELIRVEVSADLPGSLAKIAECAAAVGSSHQRRIRLLADFGDIVGSEMVNEVEASIAAAVRGFDVVSITQYDGSDFSACATLQQSQTHLLTIVGNAICKENRNYTSPECQVCTRAASAKA